MAEKNVILKDGADALFPKTKAELIEGLNDKINDATSTKMSNPMTTVGDIIYGGTNGAPARLGAPQVGGFVLQGRSNDHPIWAAIEPTTIQYPSGTKNMVPYHDSASAGWGTRGYVGTNVPLYYLTTAPSAANTDGLKVVVLSSEPATKYDGYLYIITGA